MDFVENKLLSTYKRCIITSHFGMRKHPISGERKMHNGVDIVGSTDGKVGHTDHILAHSGGVVLSEGYDTSAGYFCNIQVSDEVTMVYYHMKGRCVYREGNTVKEGTILGYMGKTGNATGAHLHFGIKVNGEWVDPEPYLNKEFPVTKYTTVKLPIVKRGSKRCGVKALQTLLKGMGYDLGKSGVDGSFGGQTNNAVIKFQHDHGLAEDGSVGSATWAEIITNYKEV